MIFFFNSRLRCAFSKKLCVYWKNFFIDDCSYYVCGIHGFPCPNLQNGELKHLCDNKICKMLSSCDFVVILCLVVMCGSVEYCINGPVIEALICYMEQA